MNMIIVMCYEWRMAEYRVLINSNANTRKTSWLIHNENEKQSNNLKVFLNGCSYAFVSYIYISLLAKLYICVCVGGCVGMCGCI